MRGTVLQRFRRKVLRKVSHIRNFRGWHWKRGICINLSEIYFQIRDKNCYNFAHPSSDVQNELPANLRNAPLANAPFSGFLNIVKITRYATTINPKAGLGLQRQSARRQPVVQTQILVVQGLLCGNSSEKAPYYREKGPGVQGKGGQNTDTAFLALRFGAVLHLLRKVC